MNTLHRPRVLRALAGLAALLLLFLGVLGWYWSRIPERPDVEAVLADYPRAREVVGGLVTATLIAEAETLLDKPGGYLSNDRLPPGVWLDNMPNWEFGVLTQVRDLAKALRDRFSRSQSQSTEDPDLALAEPKFNFDNASWLFPASESEYRDGIRHLRAYLARLVDEDQYNAQFYARADNLNFWLATVEARLGSFSQRLAASVGQRRPAALDLAGEVGARRSTPAPEEVWVKTSWWELDDVFYEARGYCWALLHLLRAVEVDFAAVLERKNARASLDQIIRELEGSQTPLRSPVILNGSGFGVLANHSLTLASYISRAHAAITDLRELLAQG